MMQQIKRLVFEPTTLLVVYIVAAVFIALQQISLGTHPYVLPDASKIPLDIMNNPAHLHLYLGRHFTEYNNYVIFRSSWGHLLHGQNLYGLYPAEQWDYYKYSPTFALFMGPFAALPDYLGLTAWDLCNGLVLFAAVRMLPFSSKTQCIILWFIANELLTCFSNSQSNGVMCGLIIAAFAYLRRGQLAWAALWLVAASFIKLYAAAGFCLFLFYPGKMRAMAYAAGWTILFAALPLAVTPLNTLTSQYQNWYYLMKADVSVALGISVTGWLHTWFGVTEGYAYVSLTGLVLFALPFARMNMYRDKVYQLLILSLLMIWVIIFNPKAESPTYIIAVTGVAIWYYARPKSGWRLAILLTVFVFTSLSTTDVFPKYLNDHFVKPYTIKVVPCIIAFVAVLAELMLLKHGEQPSRAEEPGRLRFKKIQPA